MPSQEGSQNIKRVQLEEHVRWVIIKAFQMYTFHAADEEAEDNSDPRPLYDTDNFLAIVAAILVFAFGDGCSFEQYWAHTVEDRTCSVLVTFAR